MDLIAKKEMPVSMNRPRLLGCLGEHLGVTGHLLVDLEDVETNSLGERTVRGRWVRDMVKNIDHKHRC